MAFVLHESFFRQALAGNFFFQTHPPTPSTVKWSAPAVTLIRTVQLSGCSESLDSMTADALLLIFLPLLPTYKKKQGIANQVYQFTT